MLMKGIIEGSQFSQFINYFHLTFRRNPNDVGTREELQDDNSFPGVFYCSIYKLNSYFSDCAVPWMNFEYTDDIMNTYTTLHRNCDKQSTIYLFIIILYLNYRTTSLAFISDELTLFICMNFEPIMTRIKIHLPTRMKFLNTCSVTFTYE